jgi:exoribonuclease R
MEYKLFTKDYKSFQLHQQSSENDDPIEFNDATLANGCFVGDIVTWNSQNGCRIVTRGEHPPLSGILDMCSKTKYGVTSRDVPMYLFTPYRKDYPSLVVGCSDTNFNKNKLVLVRTEETTPIGRSLPRGNLQEILGFCGDPKIERLALIWAYTPFKMPNSLLKIEPVAKKREFEIRPSVPKNTFHIDPPECKDVDDVISIEKIGNIFRIWITISDVGEWIEEGSDLDKYAQKAGATTYENGVPIRPMLPPQYSEGVCSLLPRVNGLGVSLVMDWDGKNLDNLIFLKTVVRVDRTYNYEQADKENSENFRVLRDITASLTKNKDPNSHDIIEAFMILYNCEVAQIIRKNGIGILRRHEATDIIKWERFQSVAPELAPLAYNSAEYCPADAMNVYHASLGADAYCTATSPIRRYADLVNQRILKHYISLANPTKEPSILNVSIEYLNKRQREIKKYERDVFFITNMFANEKRILKGIVVDWKESSSDKQVSFHIYIPDWKRILKWKTVGQIIDKKVLCYIQQKTGAIQTYIEEMMVLRFEIYWNMQQRSWEDKMVLRIV